MSGRWNKLQHRPNRLHATVSLALVGLIGCDPVPDLNPSRPTMVRTSIPGGGLYTIIEIDHEGTRHVLLESPRESLVKLKDYPIPTVAK